MATTSVMLMLLFRTKSVDTCDTELVFYETLTHDVYRSAIEHNEEILGYRPQKLGPKNYLFSTTSQLSGNFEGQNLWQGTWCRRSRKGVGNHKGSPTLSQSLINFGSLTAKNRTGVFTHPPKILRFSSLPGFAHEIQTTELNQTLPHGKE